MKKIKNGRRKKLKVVEPKYKELIFGNYLEKSIFSYPNGIPNYSSFEQVNIKILLF